MVLAYLLCPSLLGLNVFDFHPVSLATPFLLYAMLALNYKRYGWFLLACVLAASCKEDIPLAIAMFGILVIWKYKLPRLGTLLIVGGTLWSLLAFMVIIPHFYPGIQHNNYWYRYEDLGSSPGAAVVNLLLHPWLLVTNFITLDRFYYLVGLVRSFGFLSLLAPEWLLPALPSLAVNLLSDDPLLYSGVYHYNAAIIPFVILAAIYGTRRVLLFWLEWRGESIENFTKDTSLFLLSQSGGNAGLNSLIPPARTILTFWTGTLLVGVQVVVTCLAATGSVAYSGLTRTFIQPRLSSLVNMGNHQWRRFSECMAPIAGLVVPMRLQKYICIWIFAMLTLNFFIGAPLLNIFWATHEPGSREQHIQQLLDMIPHDASVSASVSLNPHLTERLYVTVFPEITFSTSEKNVKNVVQYVIVDLYVVFPEDQVKTTNALNQLVTSKQFRVLARAEGVILLVRRTP